MGADEPNWEAIRTGYLAGKKPRELARLYGSTPGGISTKACRDGWGASRKSTQEIRKEIEPAAVAALVVDEVVRTKRQQLDLASAGAAKLAAALALCDGPSDLRDWSTALKTLQQVQRLALDQAPPSAAHPPEDAAKQGNGGGMTIVPADSTTWKDEATHGRA